ncbi:MAG: ribonucleoside-diphosphate reductase subunit alpha [Gammaproteobacteria bacterium]|nr:ribonucleoside-diphosphate reductase subunit alpha [Gammaproteobacteria bacterium]MYF54128.1 ribonucleoside-diphosphate reductase subunit alpha [Gammaproteobacteria bacterium]MYK42499.1 ribonucleoside-diphosphate reductase subunit alpha [Gammaproteobacteria bacterium]
MDESQELRVIKRDGRVVPFDQAKVHNAISKAFIGVEGVASTGSTEIRNQIDSLAQSVTERFERGSINGAAINIEDIQDQVELALMREGLQKIARAYVIWRENRAQVRKEKQVEEFSLSDATLTYIRSDGTETPLERHTWNEVLEEICFNLDSVNPEKLFEQATRDAFKGITENEVFQALTLAAKTLIESEPNYGFVAARLLMIRLRQEAIPFLYTDLNEQHQFSTSTTSSIYQESFPAFIQKAVELGFISPELANFDLQKLSSHLRAERDQQFSFLGLQNLYDRYFLQQDGTRFELPQSFFMRVSMGLAIQEVDREERAIEFYNLLSSFDFMSSTPTLFNSGTVRSQLSSCYISTVPDDLRGIFDAINDNAMLSKWAGGLGNDWTRVRAMGSYIQGTNGKSQGVVPFLKIVNDTAVAVNQGGKRKGAVCSYLETWHLDIEEFLDLRKNTGDDRRRTHDMNTANWIPDLFMERVMNKDLWTLFSPSDVPELHDLYGTEFRKAYEHAEAKARQGEISQFRVVQAEDLWRKMLESIYETGHPWFTFKDSCNIRSPQKHTGVIHSSNLCTEITLNTSDQEIAVCNLGSLNLANHIDESGNLQLDKLRNTVRTAIRMLDNVIDINYYAVDAARDSNVRHRPIGLGLMGFQDALYQKRVPYSSPEAVHFADESMEAISYFAIEASSDLAVERGSYSTYDGSLWSQGILPLDSLRLLAETRSTQEFAKFDFEARLDWEALRTKVVQQGMRNSNTLAIAPTATIANIVGINQSIEPAYQNLYAKQNISGDFVVVNPYLVNDLKEIGLWDQWMFVDLKAKNGSIQTMDRVPNKLKELYRTAFEIEPKWIIAAAARRQKWIDQSQSLNLYIAQASGRKLDEMYREAWKSGLKTTYYLRSLGATDSEKSTIDEDTALAAVPRATTSPTDEETQEDGSTEFKLGTPAAVPETCSIDDPDCEACQ